ncbi:DUF3575 domain-containing protein [Spirosoma validum]|uniref:DUF3575 domain-containing protein n=1 Tax=Spirosoma validum TaxID=2771355 RepID=A0A927B2H7_9BACT|nr:DUF3575 domain-containing protein [Spirosoma validum]MBD2754200.1 DUF3575 domain-containing protein [Spirosoma validum]
MKKLYLIGCLGLFLADILAAKAQSAPSLPLPSLDAEESQRWVVKFAPLSLLDPDNTVQFGAERLVGQRHGIQLELGYGWQALNAWRSTQNARYSDREIWRGRVEWRYYLHQTNRPVGQYVALEGFYKQVNVRENGTIGIGCTTGPCQYYQLFSAPLQKYVGGGHIKFGRQFVFSADNPRLLIDLYIGLGVRWRTIERAEKSVDSYYYYSSGYDVFNSFSETPYALISVAYGVKVGYSF